LYYKSARAATLACFDTWDRVAVFVSTLSASGMHGRAYVASNGGALSYVFSIRTHQRRVNSMSAYPLEDVIHRWDVGKLTQEQVIGQILLLLQGLDERLGELERRELERGREDKLAKGKLASE